MSLHKRHKPQAHHALPIQPPSVDLASSSLFLVRVGLHKGPRLRKLQELSNRVDREQIFGPKSLQHMGIT